MNELLEILKAAREKLSYSQEYIAEKMGVSTSTISRWELGRTGMTLQNIECYARVVSVNMSDVFSILASNGKDEPRPIAEILVEVYTEKAFKVVSETVCELGIEQAAMTTKRRRIWK